MSVISVADTDLIWGADDITIGALETTTTSMVRVEIDGHFRNGRPWRGVIQMTHQDAQRLVAGIQAVLDDPTSHPHVTRYAAVEELP